MRIGSRTIVSAWDAECSMSMVVSSLAASVVRSPARAYGRGLLGWQLRERSSRIQENWPPVFRPDARPGKSVRSFDVPLPDRGRADRRRQRDVVLLQRFGDAGDHFLLAERLVQHADRAAV